MLRLCRSSSRWLEQKVVVVVVVVVVQPRPSVRLLCSLRL
jgi:hypothetical protein